MSDTTFLHNFNTQHNKGADQYIASFGSLPYFDRKKSPFTTASSAALPEFIEKKLQHLEEELFQPRKNGKHLVLGKQPSANATVLQSNDYLSLSKHPSIVEAQVNTLQSSGQELVMSAVFFHEGSSKDVYERKMAEYVGYEKAILSQSGWAANVGLIQALADSDTPIYIDFFTHMSLWEGIKSAEAKAFAFRHNSPEHLEKLIKRNGPGIILVDSVYSTTGTVSPLSEIADISDKYGCVFVVDESHSLGTHGPNGSGLVAELGIADKVHFITASLAKAFAGRAGIIFCGKRFANCFPYIARPAIFSSVLLPHEIAGLSATLDIIKDSDERRYLLHEKSDYLREGLDSLGYAIESESQIISLEPGTEELAELLRDTLEEREIFGSIFCSPATPKNRTLMRFSMNSDLSYDQIDYLLSVCAEIRSKVHMLDWRSTKRKPVCGGLG